MKNKATKVMALAVGASILFGTATTAVHALNSEAKQPAKETKTVSAPKSAGETAAKDETVYVFTGTDGSVQKVLVNNWLQNTKQAQTIDDATTLTGIENVKGEETFTDNGNGKLVWDAKGADIYYQGTTDRKVPVEMAISYTLDGKKISADELAGKSGRVTIRFDYKNTQFEQVKINGKDEKIYVPFVALTGTLLDSDVFRNVTITNGKMENLGNGIAVIGIALPGMQENLNISKEDLELPSYVEIAADVENFEMAPTMTVASAALFDNFNSEDIDFSELKENVGKMSDGMNKLMDGSDQLYNGLCTLLEQSKVLVSGIDQLAAGATKLQSGADALSAGASQLHSGASQLSEGLDTLNSNSDTLNGGAAQVFNTLLSTANSQLSAAGLSVPTLTIGNYAEVLNNVIASLDKDAVYQSALQKVTEGVNAKRGEIEEKVTAVVKEQVQAKVTAEVTAAVREGVAQKVQENETVFRTAVVKKATSMTLEQYEAAVKAGLVTQEQQAAIDQAVKTAMDAEVEKQMESDAVKGMIQQKIEAVMAEQMQSEQIKAMIAENTEAQVQKAISDMMASDEVQAQLQAAAEGAKAVISLKTSLDSYNSFYLGVQAYTSGVASATAGAKELASGADTLKNGMSTLNTGVGELSSGIGTMKSKSPELINGITKLRDGSKLLDDGLKTMMEEGIQKLIDLADEDLESLTGRVSATIDVAKRYNTFSGIDAGTEGRVKFIYKTDAIEQKDLAE